jgi:peroxiredoxin
VRDALVRKGGDVWVVSTDAAADLRTMREEDRLPFVLLSDAKAEIIGRYGLVHAGAGPKGAALAIPANVLIAPGGRIAWRRVAERIQDRPSPETILDEIAKL